MAKHGLQVLCVCVFVFVLSVCLCASWTLASDADKARDRNPSMLLITPTEAPAETLTSQHGSFPQSSKQPPNTFQSSSSYPQMALKP